MTAKELLSIFEQAVEDWSKPVDELTSIGLCHYFSGKFNIAYYRPIAPWTKYETTKGVMQFYKKGTDVEGRRQRLEVLKLVVRDLKEDIKQQEDALHNR